MIIGDAVVGDSGNFDHLEFFNVHPHLGSWVSSIFASTENVAAAATPCDLALDCNSTAMTKRNLVAQ